MVTLGGLPHSLRYFFRSSLLNFLCGQEPSNTNLENMPSLAGSVFGPAGLFASLDPRFMALYKFFPLFPSSQGITLKNSVVKDANSLSLFWLFFDTFVPGDLPVPDWKSRLMELSCDFVPPVFVGVLPLFGALRRTLGGGSPPWRLIP